MAEQQFLSLSELHTVDDHLVDKGFRWQPLPPLLTRCRIRVFACCGLVRRYRLWEINSILSLYHG